MALHLRAKGVWGIVFPANGKSFTLKEQQGFVGGYIQIITTPDGRFMVMNEDGKGCELPLNAEATAMVASRLHPGDYVVGDVLVCTDVEAGATDDDDDDTD